jgi:16S rRNA U516 pseudouridylate synthase RsuA-like enzyme
MFAARGKTVLQLHLEKIGNYSLPGELSPGEFMYLTLEEWNDIRAQAGLGPWQEE